MRNVTTIILATLMLSSCATIFSGSRQKFTITTNVDSSNVSIVNNINGREVYTGKTPATVKLKRSSGYFQKAEYNLSLWADGYSKEVVPINFKINPWYWGNIAIGGLAGMVGIDPGTGAMWRSKQKDINVTLKKQ